jgi:hypothetical protein
LIPALSPDAVTGAGAALIRRPPDQGLIPSKAG